MWRLIEDYKENSALLCKVHQPGKKKTRDIETLNTCLFYLIFKNDLSYFDVNDLRKRDFEINAAFD